MRLGGTWFSEPPYIGMQTHFQVQRVLHQRTSEYQSIEVYDSVTFGKMLALDRTVQTTVRDEFFYHEMLVHPAMISHPQPKAALIIGGGDGGALRRMLEHGVEKAVLCELDPQVVEVCREHLPEVSAGAFDDPRSELRFEDGLTYLKNSDQEWDVIIVDAPDPVGPAKALFEPEFYRLLNDRLTDAGVVAVQSESPLYMASQTASTHLNLRKAFPHVATCISEVPSYPGVSWSFTLAYKQPPPQGADIGQRFEARALPTRYYSPEFHRGAFSLPAYFQKYLDDSIAKGAPADEHPFFPIAKGLSFVDQFWDKPTEDGSPA